MYYYLNGILAYNDGAVAVIDCGGVGYKCAVSMNTSKKLGAIGEKVKVYTYLNVKEDALELYGFYDQDEQSSFIMLISINGVGPKAAMAILSALTPQNLALAVTTSDYKAITVAQGVGPKLAQRIVLELKDKMKSISIDSPTVSYSEFVSKENSEMSNAIDALIVLGYTRAEAVSALSKADKGLNTEALVKFALAQLMR